MALLAGVSQSGARTILGAGDRNYAGQPGNQVASLSLGFGHAFVGIGHQGVLTIGLAGAARSWTRARRRLVATPRRGDRTADHTSAGRAVVPSDLPLGQVGTAAEL